MLALPSMLLWASAAWVALANPGLLSAIRKDPAKLKMVLDGLSMESLYMSSSDLVRRGDSTTFPAFAFLSPTGGHVQWAGRPKVQLHLLSRESGVSPQPTEAEHCAQLLCKIHDA